MKNIREMSDLVVKAGKDERTGELVDTSYKLPYTGYWVLVGFTMSDPNLDFKRHKPKPKR